MVSNLIYLLITLFVLHARGDFDPNIINRNVERTIELTSQLVKINHKIIIENTLKEKFNHYEFVITNKEKDNLSYILVRDSSNKVLDYTVSNIAQGVEFKISFGIPAPKQVITVIVVYTKILEPYPKEITQLDNQFVRYFGNIYFYSPYKTDIQNTVIHLSSNNIEFYTKTNPAPSNKVITYGPYTKIEAFTQEELILHYESNVPFLTITRLERTIEISHWGNIAVEETIDILHTGATLKGQFSRYNFQKDMRNSQPCVKSYKTVLPASATDVYYRDTNGNISTSNMRILKDSVELDLRPRFPLFGGWKTHYTIGYNVPSFEYLFHSGDNYKLKMRVLDHVFDDMIVDELIVKIILPEGSKNIKLITPYSVNRLPNTKHFTYLDTIGRPVITFTKQNLVEDHISDFNLDYTYPKIMLLQEPILVVGFLIILFLFFIICTRLDFSISPEKDHKSHKE